MFIATNIEITKRNSVAEEFQILKIEKLLGCRFPEGYREFLKFSDGIEIKPVGFHYEINDAKLILAIIEFYGLEEIVRHLENIGDFLPEFSVPISSDPGGCYVVMNMKTGEIYFRDDFFFPEDENDLQGHFFLLANGFDDFISKLKL